MKKTLLCLTLIPFIAFGQIQYKTMNMEVDFSSRPKEFNNYWNCTGFTPGDLLFREDMQQTLDYLACVPNQGVKYIRPHWMLNLIGSKKTGTKHAEFNFEKFDAAFDEMISRGFKPIFEIMGFPNLEWDVPTNEYDKDAQAQKNEVKQWVPDFEQKDDYMQWYEFVKVLIKHLEERYGKEELKTWYFECTNEPDLKHFWGQSLPALLNYWDATSEAIKAVNPEYIFGGPGTAKGVSEHYKAILAHCDNGKNAITRKNGAVLDFISVHRKARPYVMIDNELACVNYIRKNHPKFADTPFWNDEADPMAGWQRPFWWRADTWYSTFVAHSIDAHNRLSIDSAGVNFSLLSNDNGFMGNWYHRTHLARHTNPRNEDNFWLFKRPDLSVMTLLALSTGERYDVTGYPSTRENTVVIASKNVNGEIVLLAVNKPEFGEVFNSNPQHNVTPEQRERYNSSGTILNLSLKNLGIEKAKITHIKIDNLHGNAFTDWVALGKPEEITKHQYDMIAANQEPVIVETRAEENLSNLRLTMPPASICMVVVSAGEKNAGGNPKIISVEDYAGYNGEATKFVRWEQASGQTVTYDVYASYDGGAYQKINPQPLLDCGFLDVMPKGAGKAEYRIESKCLGCGE